jgi:hypothetical protein
MCATRILRISATNIGPNRNVEDLLAERGIDIGHETVRFWWNDDGDQHANASQEHASYASRGPGQRLTAAAVWVNDGNWRPARAVVRRKPSFGLAFPGDRRTDDDFRLLSLFGQGCPRRGDVSEDFGRATHRHLSRKSQASADFDVAVARRPNLLPRRPASQVS